MDKERYFKVFSKRYSEGIDILGIKLIPLAISEELRLKFKLENPNDLPYTKSSLIGFLKQEIGEFNEFLNLYDYVPTPIIECLEIYVSDELKRKTQQVLKKKDEIKIEAHLEKEYIEEITLKVEHVSFKYKLHETRDGKEVMLINFVKPKSGYFTETNERVDLDDAIEYYLYNQRHSGRYHDSDNYPEIDILLSEYPTMVDSDWMVNFMVTEFI